MLEACQNCMNPKGQAEADAAATQLMLENVNERKQLVMDLESAGVTFPVTELETMLDSKHMPVYETDAQTPIATHDDDTEALQNTSNEEANENQMEGPTAEQVTAEDYATNMPEDLKDLLRRHYTGDDSFCTSLDSIGGEDEKHTSPRQSPVPIDRAPFWCCLKRGVTIMEDEESVETQSQSAKSKHAWLPENQDKSRVTVIYPKTNSRKVRLWIAGLCCLQILAAILFALFYPRGETIETTTEVLETPRDSIIEEQDTQPQQIYTAFPSAAPILASEAPTEGCVASIEVNKNCFSRGEPILATFENCFPVPNDWLALFEEEKDLSPLTDDALDWKYTCGNKQCRGVIQSSMYTFQYFTPGNYKIHLIGERGQGPYAAKASSEVFEIVENRLDCPSPLP